MLIVCPSCASRYTIEPEKLAPAGRKVRCAACATQWLAEPEPAASAVVEPAADDAPVSARDIPFPESPDSAETTALLEREIAREAAAWVGSGEAPTAEPTTEATVAPAERPLPGKGRAGPASARRKRSGALGRLARAPAVAAGLCLALAAAGLWQREAVARTAPVLAPLFAGLGLPVNPTGIKFTAVESSLGGETVSRVLMVEGDLTNITRQPAKVPQIEIVVRDAAGTPVYNWTAEPPRPTLEPSELVRFRARLASPPENGHSVLVRFASGDPSDAKLARR